MPTSRIVVVLLLLSTSAVVADDARRAQELIGRLGHPVFSERELATQQLIQLGAVALPLLDRTINHADREISYRSRLIRDIIRELDLQHRLDAFAAEGGGNQDPGLAGWKRYRSLTDNAQRQRELFVAMYRAAPELMLISDDEQRVILVRLIQRCQEMRQALPLGTGEEAVAKVAAVLFLSTDERLELPDNVNSTLYFLCQQPDFFYALRTGTHKAGLRNLVAQWLKRKDNLPVKDAFALTMQHDLAGLVARARKVAVDPQQDAEGRLYAILTVSKLGSIRDTKLLETLLDDTRLCSRFPADGANYEIRIGDVALAGILHLNQRDYVKYAYPRLRNAQPFLFAIETLGFPHQEARDEAVARWKNRED